MKPSGFVRLLSSYRRGTGTLDLGVGWNKQQIMFSGRHLKVGGGDAGVGLGNPRDVAMSC